MKSILFLIFLSNSALANIEVNFNKCLKPAKRYYYQHAGPSDVARNFSKLQILTAGEKLKYADKVIAIYEEDKLVYSGSGSYYSGYYIDYIVVNPQTCEVDDLLNVYSE